MPFWNDENFYIDIVNIANPWASFHEIVISSSLPTSQWNMYNEANMRFNEVSAELYL